MLAQEDARKPIVIPDPIDRLVSLLAMYSNRGWTMKKIKPKPMFKSDVQEAAFWASHDSTEYIHYSKSRQMVFPKLKPSTEMISLRLPKW